VALLGKVIEHGCGGGPGAGLGFSCARKLHFAEQNIGDLFRAARIERLARDVLNFGFKRARLLCEVARQPRQHVGVDRDAALLHAGEDRHQRTLEGLVDRRHAFRHQAGAEQAPHAQADVGILGADR
jgi:hypothetical protein